MKIALVTSDLNFLGTAETVLDRLTPYIRQEIDGLDTVFERTVSVRQGLPVYRALDTYIVTNFKGTE